MKSEPTSMFSVRSFSVFPIFRQLSSRSFQHVESLVNGWKVACVEEESSELGAIGQDRTPAAH